MTNRKKILNDLLKQQKEYLDGKMKLDTAKREYEKREQQKFEGVNLVEFMHTPKER